MCIPYAWVPRGTPVHRPLLVPAVLRGMVSAALEAGTQHVSRQGASPAGTSMGPLITSSLPAVPHPWLGLPPAQPHEGAAQALWVRKRNNLVSKLGSDMIVAEPQKLSGQTPQKLGKLLSRAQ